MANNETSEVYEIPAHTFDDDGFAVKCFGGGQECTPNYTNGEVTCPDCGAVLTAVCIGEL